MKLTIDQRFKLFHAEHPEVLAELARLARVAKSHGKSKCGVRMLWETMRWNFYLNAAGDDGFKFNDHFTSRYVRLLETTYPDLAGFFEQRALRST